jgi:hypothetical protein
LFTNHLKEILDTMIKENEVSDQCYNSLSKLEPIERFKTELKVHRSELFIKEMIQINWANIETSFKKMNNHFDDFVKGYLQSNKIAKEFEGRVRQRIPTTKKNLLYLGETLKVSDKKYGKHISLFATEFFLVYNYFTNLLQKLLLTDNEIGLFSQHIAGFLVIEKNYEKVKRIQNLDICTLAELVINDPRFHNSGLSFNMDNFHLLRQTRNMLSHHDITTSILSFQIQSLKAFMSILLDIYNELIAFKQFDLIPNTFADTRRAEQLQQHFTTKIVNGETRLFF